MADAIEAEKRKTEEISRRIALEQQYEALKEICVVNAAAAEADHTSQQQAVRKVERESNAMKIQTARVLQAMVDRMDAVNDKLHRQENKVGRFQGFVVIRFWRREMQKCFIWWDTWSTFKRVQRRRVG
eukprot:SAG31_NODE_8059_length_1531_cov_1.099162_2_plen_128_part_00